MSNLSDIIVNDGKSTPVAHTFKPASIKDGIATFEDRVSGIAIAYPRFKFSMRDPISPSGAYKHKTRLSLPVLKAATGANAQGYTASPSVSHAFFGNLDLNIPALSTLDERKDFLAYMRNMINHATFADQVLNYERWF